MTKDKRLSVPPELQHLIEKRELQDRREAQRRGDTDRRECDVGPLSAVDSVEDPELPVTEDQRSGEDRRKKRERRQAARRKEDDKPTTDS
jgi:hypothetical protein